MTLDIAKFIRNAVLKQMKIHHIEANVQVFTKEDLTENAQIVVKKLQDMNGETYLDDAQYLLFFSKTDGGFDKDFIDKKLFKCVDSALGGNANKLNPSDLKAFSLTTDTQPVEEPEEVEDVEPEDTDVEDTGVEDIEHEDLEANGENAEAVDDVNESVENPEPNEKFVFVKITVK